MILFELTGNNEGHPVYKQLEISNGDRQFSLLESIIGASLSLGRPLLSHQVIKALNYQAITCLHVSAGEYRPCGVTVGVYKPPEFWQVQALMDDLVDKVNWNWDKSEPVYLACWALWKLNHVHPFINGNGRTARAICYYIICMKIGRIPPGSPILPELLSREPYRSDYVTALQHADATLAATGNVDLQPLHELVQDLLEQQIGISPVQPPTSDGTAASE